MYLIRKKRKPTTNKIYLLSKSKRKSSGRTEKLPWLVLCWTLLTCSRLLFSVVFVSFSLVSNFRDKKRARGGLRRLFFHGLLGKTGC